MLTLQELKQVVDVPGFGTKLPTAKQLRESGTAYIRKRLDSDAEISVYQSGFVLFCVRNHSTVFPLYLCKDYLYVSDGNTIHLSEHFFNKERWYLRLVLEGEDRLNRNYEERERNRTVSYSAISEEWAVMKAPTETTIEHLVKQETVEEILEMLTEKQKAVISRYYLQEKTQMQIAAELGISHLAVQDFLFRAVKKIRKIYALSDRHFDSDMRHREGE